MLKSWVRSTLSLRVTLPAWFCASGVSVKVWLAAWSLADPLTVDVLVDRRDIKNAAVMRVRRAGRRARLEGRIERIELDLMQGAQAASRAGEAEVGVVRAAEVAGELRRRQLQLSDLDAAEGVRERLGRGVPMHVRRCAIDHPSSC